ncbi:uncharacterized protein [Lepeophtheirus salmonis]|uniref:uncharacterized protein n=1 Tax=Lepeophtheirus salmonis TaxID=72036 RepID=UPI001AE10EE9|nr:uncharacterized protein LOC121130503 [Lepeophtheirus salmonis]
MGKNTVQTQAWLKRCYLDSTPLKTTIRRRFAYLKRGRTDTNDAKRPGRPNELVIPEKLKKTLRIIIDNRKVKLQEIGDTLKLLKGGVYTIIHEHLDMKKLFSKYGSLNHLLLVAFAFAEMFTRNKKEFWRRYITMDETWITNSLQSQKGSLLSVVQTEKAVQRLKHRLGRTGPSGYWLLAELKTMLRGKRSGSDEEVIVEIEAYFGGLDKSF